MPKFTDKERIEKFWQRVDISDFFGCWEWTAGKTDNGYGRISNGEREVRSHRFAFELAYRPIPEGLLCLHKCDNKLCCNPNHLYLGTHKDNNRDRSVRNRDSWPRGMNASAAKLTNEDVWKIRVLLAEGLTERKIASKFGVEKTAVHKIKHGKSWGHI